MTLYRSEGKGEKRAQGLGTGREACVHGLW